MTVTLDGFNLFEKGQELQTKCDLTVCEVFIPSTTLAVYITGNGIVSKLLFEKCVDMRDKVTYINREIWLTNWECFLLFKELEKYE